MSHRVLHFLWSGGIGGAERAVYQIVREEVRRGQWDVALAFGHAEGPWFEAAEALGCEVLDLRMRGGADLPRALRGIGQMRGFDIHHFHVLELGQMAASARCRDATRVFTQRHGAHSMGEPLVKKARRTLGGVLLRRYVHAVSGNTEHALRYAMERYRLRDVPSRVTYNGIDFSLLSPTLSRSQARTRLGFGPDDIVMGSSGNLKRWKRLDRLVDILPSSPRLRLLVVGDGPVRPELEMKAQTMGIADRLQVTGLVQGVADYLQAVDVFILPSTADESFGNSVVEAMALGIPSLVFSDSPGICEHIRSGVTGFIVSSQSELVDTVLRLGEHPDLRANIGQAAARHVRSKYTLENMHAAYSELYRLALSRRGLASTQTFASEQ